MKMTPLPPAEVSNISSIPENGDVSEIDQGQSQFSGVPFFATTPAFPRQCRNYIYSYPEKRFAKIRSAFSFIVFRPGRGYVDRGDS